MEEPRLQRVNLSAAVYAEIRKRILHVVLPPGAKLSPEDLARVLGVSRTPVREALLLLARELLVVVAPSGSARVAEPSAAHLVAINEVRRTLEGWAAGQAATRISDPEIAELRSRCAVEHEMWRAGDASALGEADEALHQAVIRACGNPVLADLLSQVSGYRVWLRQLYIHEMNTSNDYDDHLAILRALSARDAAAAQTAMIEHIEAGTRRELTLLERRAAAGTGSGAETRGSGEGHSKVARSRVPQRRRELVREMS